MRFSSSSRVASAVLAVLPLALHEGHGSEIAELSRWIARDPRNAELLLERSELERLAGQLGHARADLERAARLDPGLCEVDLAWAALLAEEGRFEPALERVDRFLRACPEDSQAHLLRASALAALDRSEEAATSYDAAIRVAPQASPDVYLARARARASLGGEHATEALAGLDEGIARLGPVPGLVLAAVDLELVLGRTDAALERLELLAARSSRKETWRARRGDVLASAGRGAEALGAYREALAELEGLRPKLRSSGATRALEARLRQRIGDLSKELGR